MNKIEKHTGSSWKRTMGLVALLLLIAVFATLCGSRWLQHADEFVVVGEFSPDGSKFIAYHYKEHTSNTVYVYDAQTMERVEVTPLATSRSRPFRWSSDGTKLVGFDDQTSNHIDYGIMVDVGKPPQQIVSYQGASILQAGFDNGNQPIFLKNWRSQLDIIVGDSVADTVEYGQSERINWFDLTSNATLFLRVDPVGGQGDDFLLTDGATSTCLFIDIVQQQRVLLPTNAACIVGNSEYFAELGPAVVGKQDVVIRPYRDPGEELATVPYSKGMPHNVSSDGNRIVQCCGFGTKRYTITVRELDSGDVREYVTPPNVNLAHLSDRECIFLANAGELVRMDLEDGSTKELLNIRPFHREWKAGAIGGIALLWIVALAGGTWWRTKHPFAEMMCLMMLSLFVVIGWSAFGSGFMKRIDIESTVFVFFGAALTFFMLWASTAKSFWGVTLPCSIAGATAAIGVLFLWCEGDPKRAFEGSMGSTLVLVWMLLGMWVVRGRGMTTNEAVDAELTVTGRDLSQISIKQILLLVASCCLLFSVIRFVDLSEFVANTNVAVMVVWLTTYVGALSLISIVACVAALSTKNVLFSGLIFLLSATCTAGFHFLVTRSWEVNLLWTQQARYGLIVAIGVLVWTACRYCQAKGHRFVRTQ